MSGVKSFTLLFLPTMMKRFRWTILLFTFSFFYATGFSQDTLPKFTVENKGGGRVVVSWSNPYPNLIQLAVQRSYDSIKRFGSVYSTTSPQLPVNGFSDKIPEGVRVYYRIFYVMDGGAYYFTQSKQPLKVDDKPEVKVDNRREILDEKLQDLLDAKNAGNIDPNKPIYLKVADTSAFTVLLYKDFRNFRDSIMMNTKDTLVQMGIDTLYVRVYDPPFVEKTSEFVFTNKDGYIVIKLDDANKKKYQVIFMEENETPVIDIKQVKEPFLILDKTNFYRAGWYKFTLKENGRIKEKGKLFLPRDFRP
jgi:hypothetical protein